MGSSYQSDKGEDGSSPVRWRASSSSVWPDVRGPTLGRSIGLLYLTHVQYDSCFGLYRALDAPLQTRSSIRVELVEHGTRLRL